ncbi:DUF1800 domain-containing protein [Rhodoferax sp.]|uniref:DUF1800 domain-containing protein n=1 Tax=Rhodoferax sp. TaxID=50421 RepID=UPI002765C13C|nr:DUF1800 domain-containing protein [Rhodoferax sp.]
MANPGELEDDDADLVTAIPPQETATPALPARVLAATTLATGALTACGGGGSDASPAPTPTPIPAEPVSDAQAARFLLHAQFSATDADIAAVRAQGYSAWLEQQFNAPMGTSGWDWLTTNGYGTVDANKYYDSSAPGDYMIWQQLMSAPDAVRKRAALALSEFFVVSLTGINFTWRGHGMAQYWDILASNAFGNYRKLLEDVTLNAAMGNFLNTRGNKKENSSGRQPDENYAREVMQLFSIGLNELNLDGTEKRDAQGNKRESYTASDVSNLARVFTGYDFDQSQNVDTIVDGSRRIPSTAFTRLPMSLKESDHSTLAASFLGTTIPAGTPGAPALRTALDTLFNHPNVGPFLGRQMIQRLITSNPSPAYVARVAAAFNNNGAGVRGDLKAMFRAIFLDDEARNASGLSQALFGKLREPMLRLVQWGRTFGLTSTAGTWRIGDLSNPATQLGQSPLRSPSVFNFFRPGYVPPSSALASGQSVAPEFQLVSESSVGGYLNYMQNVIQNGINSDLKPAYTNELALVTNATALVNRLNLLLCAGQLSSATLTLIVNALNATAVSATSSASVKLNQVAAAVLLVMASAEYLAQK